MTRTIINELTEAAQILKQFIEDGVSQKEIHNAADYMIKCINAKGKIIICGNGGSMSDAMHFASELTGRYRGTRDPIAAIALSDPSHLSCVANDFGYRETFKRAFVALARPGDVLVCLSTSGKSENINVVAEYAKMAQYTVIGLTGRGGGELKNYCDVEIRAPYSQYADRAQEIHQIVIHILCKLIEEGLGYE